MISAEFLGQLFQIQPGGVVAAIASFPRSFTIDIDAIFGIVEIIADGGVGEGAVWIEGHQIEQASWLSVWMALKIL